MEETLIEEGETNKDIEVAPALIAVHPTQKSIAVAVGSDLRVFDFQGASAVSLVDDTSGPFHRDSIRAIRYSADGNLFVSAGDDKVVKIWFTESWCCICTVPSEKRVSAVALSNDSLYVCFADKFGVVWVVDLDGFDGNQMLANKKAAPLLAHYCSIITSLEFSPDGRFVISADRDFKIRVTVLPKKPLDGAHEIQNYPQGFLVSGSGDSTVRLWDISSGSLLDTCEVGAKAELLESNGKEEECNLAVTDLCTFPDDKLLEKLQGSVSVEEKVFLAAAEAVKTSMSNLLVKKQYSTEKREFRKRARNDRKIKQ
ncbi:trna (guanine-n(7)-)-methyltransferase non-catalytic subunit wdr4 [Quercus suber]|uniref:Trna (Guanine-n(7)-)-methyltransferase non-catalytic subunit wdr4 n=1 Tax=Quercus suber TaxID=58331 RepID=A0AAW0KYD8_QUESU